MHRTVIAKTMLAACLAGLLASACYAQTEWASAAAPSAASGSRSDSGSLPRFGLAVSAGSLGAGIEGATALAHRTNLRFGFNYFSYSLSGKNGSSNLAYDGTLRVESGEVLIDEYIAGPFHVSTGALVYDGFRGTGTVKVAGGQNITLNNVHYISSPSDPVTGTGTITARKTAPVFLLGFGDLLPRSNRHFTVNFDIGAAFQGSPKTQLNLLGSVCTPGTSVCSTIASNTSVQNNITGQQNKINSDLKPFQFYPIIRIFFGYKF